MSAPFVSRALSPAHIWRAGIVTVLAALTALISPGIGADAAPPTSPLTTDPADAAAGWLSGELVDGQYLMSSFDTNADGMVDPATEAFPDPGLTADAVLAFAAAGSAGDAAQAATDWLETQVSSYTGDGTAESYSGALAKLILVADVMDREATDFGGQDLVSRLLALQSADGRFSDMSAFGDFSGPIGQSLAIIALDRAGPDGAPPAAVDFLVGVQCTDGGFVSDLSVLPCDVGEVDASALAAQALLVGGRDDEAGQSGAFLLAQQAADGSLGASGTADANGNGNANSTGVAVPALRALGEDDAADQAVEWLASLQVGTDEPAEQQGAFAFDATGFDAMTASRATPQAVLGVTGVALTDLTAPVDPIAYGLGTEDDSPTGENTAGGTSSPETAARQDSTTGFGLAGWLAAGAGILFLGLVVVTLLVRRSRTSTPT